jgi:hypothetical protein
MIRWTGERLDPSPPVKWLHLANLALPGITWRDREGG